MHRAVVYSMDTVFAIYVILIAISSFSIMFDYANAFDRTDLRLSRLARDAYNIQLTTPGLNFPDDVSIDPQVCELAESAMTGHAFILIAEEGQPSSDDFIACLIDPKEKKEIEKELNK